MSETTSNPTSATNNNNQTAVVDKYNVETAEILANEAQVHSQNSKLHLKFSFRYSVIDFFRTDLAFANLGGGAHIRATSHCISHRCEFAIPIEFLMEVWFAWDFEAYLFGISITTFMFLHFVYMLLGELIFSARYSVQHLGFFLGISNLKLNDPLGFELLPNYTCKDHITWSVIWIVY